MMDTKEKKESEIIFIGGTVFPGKGLPENLDFVAVKSNKIVGLGKIGQENEYITPKTKVVLLNKNQMVMPGIHDNHIHLIQAGMLEKYA
ncbi:MAG: hypothetical protein RR131_06335, partial [Anaerovorax sp.]